MHRFCVNGPLEQGTVVEFPAEEAAHAARVLRLFRFGSKKRGKTN